MTLFTLGRLKTDETDYPQVINRLSTAGGRILLEYYLLGLNYRETTTSCIFLQGDIQHIVFIVLRFASAPISIN
jgi:hypothetical protein